MGSTVSRALDNPINWSFPFGGLFGIRIRLHVLFILGAVVVLFHEWSSAGGAWINVAYGMGAIGLLFVIVLAHEFGHCFGARAVGGHAEEILLWPLGGLALVSPPHTARANLITAAAGPAVNVVFLIVTGVAVFAWQGTMGALPLNPFKAFVTTAPVTSELHYWLVVFFTLNSVILLFNLAPVFPFDGGRILQCLLWPSRGFADATLIATGIGMVGAIVIGVMGLVTGTPLFFAIAFFGYFTCWQQRQMIKSGMFEQENEFGYDFSRGYTSLESNAVATRERMEKKPSFLARRRARQAKADAKREAERVEQNRRQFDRILDKIQRQGMDSLTADEQQILRQETERRKSEH